MGSTSTWAPGSSVVTRADATEHWALLVRENGHFRRVDETLDETARAAIVAEAGRRLSGYREGASLRIPRTLVLVSARRG